METKLVDTSKDAHVGFLDSVDVYRSYNASIYQGWNTCCNLEKSTGSVFDH